MTKLSRYEILTYLNPACVYALSVKRDSAHEICSGQVIDGKTIIKCHCECHQEEGAK